MADFTADQGVVLLRAIPEVGVYAGDVCTIIEWHAVPGCSGDILQIACPASLQAVASAVTPPIHHATDDTGDFKLATSDCVSWGSLLSPSWAMTSAQATRPSGSNLQPLLR